MPQLKYYNTATSQWEPVIVGASGPTGPNNLPVGGATGSVLTKLSGSNYDVSWVDGYRYLRTDQITSSGTFTKATYTALNARAIRITCVGGGGGGGGVTATGTGAHAFSGPGEIGRAHV